jgi:TusA-related sulfurtransferase
VTEHTVEGARLVVDALGRRCPVPIIELARHLRDVDIGEVIAVLADDTAARVDVPAWCGMRGQEYVGAVDLVDRCGSAYLVRRLS